MAGDVARFINEQSLETPIVIGHSMYVYLDHIEIWRKTNQVANGILIPIRLFFVVFLFNLIGVARWQ